MRLELWLGKSGRGVLSLTCSLGSIRANRNHALAGAASVPGVPLTMRGYLALEVPFGPIKTGRQLIILEKG